MLARGSSGKIEIALLVETMNRWHLGDKENLQVRHFLKHVEIQLDLKIWVWNIWKNFKYSSSETVDILAYFQKTFYAKTNLGQLSTFAKFDTERILNPESKICVFSIPHFRKNVTGPLGNINPHWNTLNSMARIMLRIFLQNLILPYKSVIIFFN